MNQMSKASLRPALMILLFTIGLLLACGNDGWLRMEFPRLDSAWYFTAGKAWMEGMTPYVEFADSKGPLLWLIYGTGYLISPTSYHGVFLLEIFFYFLAFYFIFLSARVFIQDSGKAIIASFLMSMAFFAPWIHDEFRAEDFCQAFAAMALYAVVRITFSRSLQAKYFLLLGLACGCALLIKYNIAAILMVPSALTLCYALKRGGIKTAVIKTCWWGAGLASVVLPFVIYFAFIGNLGAFINEYFFNTSCTIRNMTHESIGFHRYKWPFRLVTKLDDWSNGFNCELVLATLSVLTLFSRSFRRNAFRITLIIWFLAAVAVSSVVPFPHHSLVLAVFFTLPFILVCRRLPHLSLFGVAIFGGVMILVMSVWLSSTEFSDVAVAKKELQNKQRFEKVIHAARPGEEKLTVVHLMNHDRGMGVGLRLLPGGKYWAFQSSSSWKMKRIHLKGALENRPDIIIIKSDIYYLIDRIRQNGYSLAMQYYLNANLWGEDPELFDVYITEPKK